jgi:glutamate dehydrogenase
MRDRASELAAEVVAAQGPIDAAESTEVAEFLRWLAADNCTFLGYREYEIADDGTAVTLSPVAGSGLGILRGEPDEPLKTLPAARRRVALDKHWLMLTKANSKATIHRPAYLDYVGVRKFDERGNVVGERRFLGLYTTAAYKASVQTIPIVRDKVSGVMTRAAFPPNSHDQKALHEILEGYPRDSLFQIGAKQLFEISMGILGLGGREQVRMFPRRDPLDRFMSVLAYIPRDRFNTANRTHIGEILMEEFGGTRLDWGLLFSEGALVRVHYIVHCENGMPADDFDSAAIEQRLVAATRAWTDDLRDALAEEHGEDGGNALYKRYGDAFPPGYQADFIARSAVAAIGRIEELPASGGMSMSLYRRLESEQGVVRCKLFSSTAVQLSDVVPTFEHMGARVQDEHPY